MQQARDPLCCNSAVMKYAKQMIIFREALQEKEYQLLWGGLVGPSARYPSPPALTWAQASPMSGRGRTIPIICKAGHPTWRIYVILLLHDADLTDELAEWPKQAA